MREIIKNIVVDFKPKAKISFVINILYTCGSGHFPPSKTEVDKYLVNPFCDCNIKIDVKWDEGCRRNYYWGKRKGEERELNYKLESDVLYFQRKNHIGKLFTFRQLIDYLTNTKTIDIYVYVFVTDTFPDGSTTGKKRNDLQQIYDGQAQGYDVHINRNEDIFNHYPECKEDKRYLRTIAHELGHVIGQPSDHPEITRYTHSWLMTQEDQVNSANDIYFNFHKDTGREMRGYITQVCGISPTCPQKLKTKSGHQKRINR